ncbi:nucleotidyltransferase family protein [Ramlibacter sp.]|uniref:nucleotidyltransferase family protein n=1 Tax=Ramlibacter sp. TaxID=1917967 RepID=UPI002BE1247D|nr:nucleotidyltransferase family protein [Ramlibacter sp.]HWI83216.1 nucleotidyltransferase family protein [Ramlibacter sp.]
MAAPAMILAAGRGERMRPLTDRCPKPLLQVRGKPLLQYHLEALGRSGYGEVVVNTAWLGQQIEERFGAGGHQGGREWPRIRYSDEARAFGGALETAGGIARALPLLADVFWLAGGDVYMPGFEFRRDAMERFAASDRLAHLVLVPNPGHNPKGDFGLLPDGHAVRDAGQRYTYSTVGLYRQAFFASLPAGNPQGLKVPMLPLLLAAMENRQLTAELYTGPWTDVGTPERLEQLNAS